MPSPGDILDGYTLIRRIGQGGFGEVWLCRSDSMGDFRALKFIQAANGSALDKEYEALVRYRKAAAQLRSPHLTPIEHVNRCAGGLFYIMPLADGRGADSPESPDWHPYTLATYIAARRADAAWFTSGKVIAVMQPVLRGLQCLTEAGLVHRDIKPDNILFFGGKACLGDISLMTDDRSQITRHGTPGYSTPSWFTGGHHDMYGAAAVLYSLLTGNDPDRMGRSAFIWPPQGESSLSESERNEWLRLHSVIRRATDEKVAERYSDFDAMVVGITGDGEPRTTSPTAGNRGVLVVCIGLVFALAGLATWHFHSSTETSLGIVPYPEQRSVVAEEARRAFRQMLMGRLEGIVEKIKSVQSSAPSPAGNTGRAVDRVGRSPRTLAEVDASVDQVQKQRDAARPLLNALYLEVAPHLAENPPPWSVPQNAPESEDAEYARWKTELGKCMSFIESHGADDDAMLAVSRIPRTDERYAYTWIENLLFHNQDSGPLATKAK